MSETPLSVIMFPGTQTLPLFAAQAHDCFARRGLAVEFKAAPSSEEQRSGLACGRYQIAHGAADQAVAMVAAGFDAVVVAGGDNGFNHLFVQPGINSLADLRGRTLVADAADTGWSFVLYELLRRAGLDRADYAVREVGAPRHRFEAMRADVAMAAGILNPPFALRARRAGLLDLGAVVERIGPYLGTVPYVMAAWARANEPVLVAYLAACIEGLRWTLNPANRADAVALVAQRLELPGDMAHETYLAATDAHLGLASDAKFDWVGFATTLQLRAYASGRPLQPPERYVDLGYLEQAIASIDRPAS